MGDSYLAINKPDPMLRLFMQTHFLAGKTRITSDLTTRAHTDEV